MNTKILKRTFWVFLLLFVFASVALTVIDSGLRNSTTPHGIVSFELCAYTASCDAALIQWGTKGQALALLSLGLDYLFLFLYPGLIVIGLLLIAPRVPRNLFRLTMFAAWSCVAIGLADAIENYALIQIILSESGSRYGLLASISATIKFVLLGIALLWWLFTTVKYGLLKRQPS
ncbi:hypothetical protein [Arenicella xantha]|uniref:Uncharacterized protein n=1 Tax=Arenicella xantha TaxID=644221 RepID=A0A395JPK1_9GAMM|nr:hypothetical protein [Arenicella xantha]RBP53580.1 hypothetical protein DFR28_101967 [Arenicella xantha]